jgi:hypothetical protein
MREIQCSFQLIVDALASGVYTVMVFRKDSPDNSAPSSVCSSPGTSRRSQMKLKREMIKNRWETQVERSKAQIRKTTNECGKLSGKVSNRNTRTRDDHQVIRDAARIKKALLKRNTEYPVSQGYAESVPNQLEQEVLDAAVQSGYRLENKIAQKLENAKSTLNTRKARVPLEPFDPIERAINKQQTKAASPPPKGKTGTTESTCMSDSNDVNAISVMNAKIAAAEQRAAELEDREMENWWAEKRQNRKPLPTTRFHTSSCLDDISESCISLPPRITNIVHVVEKAVEPSSTPDCINLPSNIMPPQTVAEQIVHSIAQQPQPLKVEVQQEIETPLTGDEIMRKYGMDPNDYDEHGAYKSAKRRAKEAKERKKEALGNSVRNPKDLKRENSVSSHASTTSRFSVKSLFRKN